MDELAHDCDSDIASIASAVNAALSVPAVARTELLHRAGALLERAPDDQLDATGILALLELGQLAYFEGRSLEGLEFVKRAARLSAAAGDLALQRRALTYEAALHGDLGDLPTALESAAGALMLARQLGQRAQEATLWGNLSELFAQVGDWRAALRAAERAIDSNDAAPSALHSAAQACLELGLIPKGIRYAKRCVEVTQSLSELQYVATFASAQATWARLLIEVDDLSRASKHACAAQAAAVRSETNRALQPALTVQGMCAVLAGDARGGNALLEQARNLRSGGAGVDHGQRLTLRCMARLHSLLGDHAAARGILAQQSALLLQGAAQQLKTASALSGSSAILLITSTESGVDARDALAMQGRFACVAASLEDPTGEHGQRVAQLSRLLAGDYGCDVAQQEHAYRAGLTHDLGKLGIPASILIKDDPLDDQERAVFEEHPVFGAQLLHETGSLPEVVEAVRHHHERWEGTGYPFKLSGDAIPLLARVVGICEAFDEMTHAISRGRNPWTVRRALEELLRQRGRRFDPHLTDLLVERVRRLQREYGEIDEALGAGADVSTLVQARRRLREMLESPRAGGAS